MTGSQRAGAPAATYQGATTGFDGEVTEFSGHCVYIRTMFTLTVRIWRNSDDERALMEKASPSFFLDMGQVLGRIPRAVGLPFPPTTAKISPSSI
ncbi:hypothetical protein [Bradyrhizobium canariense]|uniref:hypothetical protein n=1 Tax=Bradyrhizobium canariense TaxID=255045 RepID=UPI000A18A7DC|nr:hypothetical protein [Bradyrhizobium canariense]OSI32778.1 hypothetical protein BST65_03720 [Bradyrhizobium canariense]OSI36858.1 hypothetical protein BST66_05315 [Bradyrhizobium canariense]OSI49975.1 hypothetical protein BSZ20_06310 [Bradyrhizobium canariense]OSI55579.1 hypothetical protein BST67_04915 [Bradyrhizobium canariense]OSI58978.1 hypothetical protein BSZ15_07130 [Bradyrhizobium canariense]